MAKKKAAAKKTAQAYSGRSQKVSVKKIVAEINRTLAKLEPKATVMAKGKAAAGAPPDPQAHAIQRAIMSLRGARDVIEGTCVPGFDLPI